MTQPPTTFAPPYNASARTKREWRAQKQAWLEYEIDEQNIAAVDRANRAGRGLDFAKWLARAGDPEMLRELLPDYADFIHTPPRAKYARKQQTLAPTAKVGAEIAARIRKLWAQQYGKRRGVRGSPTSADFAIAILRAWDLPVANRLTVEDVVRAGKRSGTPRSKRKLRQK